MSHPQNINIQEENELKKFFELFFRNYKLFILCIVLAIGLAFLINRYSIPIYEISSSILIKEKDQQSSTGGTVNDFLNSSIFGKNQNFQNELWIMKSYPVCEKTVRNLYLQINYYTKGKFHYYDSYEKVPFRVFYLPDHVQPVSVKFNLSFLSNDSILIAAESKNASFYDLETSELKYQKDKWNFTKISKLGELIETKDFAFIIEPADSTQRIFQDWIYGFEFRPVASITNEMKKKFDFIVVDKLATVIQINLKSESSKKGIDIVNELMKVYSEQNLERKNHTARITIDYIEKQLNEISDSLNRTEDNLQSFRSSNQLLNISDQATGISAQYMDLQNQLAELVSRKKYFEYVSDLLKGDNYENIMLPAAIGISDQLLNKLMSEIITAQAQRSNLIENNQERNPLVQRLTIQIEILKKNISENITAFSKTTSLSIEEMSMRIRKIEAEMSRLPITQRQLGTIERRYRLNDAIFSYLMEKHAEAKITQASNLPDDLVIEPAKLTSQLPISPNKQLNYLLAIIAGLIIPFCYLILKNAFNNKIESQDDIERLTSIPVLGKILHNRYKTNNLMFEFPKSNLAESFRSLRTNLDFYARGDQRKVIMVTSCLEGDGKSFISLNLAMSYAQLGRKTILVDFDLRKPKSYFKEGEELREGLSSFMIDKIELKDIIIKSPHEKLDYIQSGLLPPNPVELIALEKTKTLLLKLKEDYEIVILDTTPLAQVTDAFLLIDHADIKLIVARYNNTLRNVFSLITKDLLRKNITNLCIVMNDNRIFTDQYGYGYGYYEKGSKRKARKRKRNIQEFFSK